jgi:hypothetical protein
MMLSLIQILHQEDKASYGNENVSECMWSPDAGNVVTVSQVSERSGVGLLR